MMRLNLSEKVRQPPIKLGRPSSRREIIWERGNLIKWIKACRADKGVPRFVKYGNELETANKITAVCWGGYNRAPGAKTTTFLNVGKQDSIMLQDENKKDWVQIVRKYGAKQTNIELLQTGKGVIDIRLRCDDCVPECIGVDC